MIIKTQLCGTPIIVIAYISLLIYLVYRKAKHNLIWNLVIIMLVAAIFDTCAWTNLYLYKNYCQKYANPDPKTDYQRIIELVFYIGCTVIATLLFNLVLWLLLYEYW
jgi:hypothetical protein